MSGVENVAIKHVVIHILNKERESEPSVTLRGTELPINLTTQRVVNELDKEYRKERSKSYGRFDANIEEHPVRKGIESYFKDRKIDFMALTRHMMEVLKEEAATERFATGGNVFFCHIQPEGKNHLIVAIVSERVGAVLTGKLDLEDVSYLNLGGLRFAGRIDLGLWESAQDRCVSFLKGSKEASDYFKQFFGCDTTLKDSLETKRLFSALDLFAKHKGMQISEKNTLIDKAKQHCDKMIAQNEPFNIKKFTNEMYPEAPDELGEVLSKQEVADGFIPNRRVVSAYGKIEGKGDGWEVKFRPKAVASGDICYDRTTKTLTITNLPPDLVKKIEAELPDNEP